MRSSRLLLALPLLGAIVIAVLGFWHMQTMADALPLPPKLASPPSPIGLPPPGAEENAWFIDTLREVRRDGTVLVFAAIVFMATLLNLAAPDAQRRLRPAVLFYFAYLVTVPLGGILVAGAKLEAYSWLRGFALTCQTLTIASLSATFLFDLVLRLLRLPISQILREVMTGGAYIIVVLSVLSRAGVQLSGLLVSSAVLTAVIGLSVQSTLGDVVSGIVLEMEDSFEVGDWVKIGDVNGQVKEIRWRHLTVETRNWETVLVPNSTLMKTNVIVLGKRQNQPRQWRRWVYFQVPFKHPPTEVIGLVDEALQNTRIDRVAAEPKPHCILFDFKEFAAQYAVRYWLTDVAVDDPTDSVVRTRIYFALRRANIELAVPTRQVSAKTRDEAARAREAAEQRATRLEALRRFALFSMLTEDELGTLAAHLAHAPFARGETITRQGAEAHWLYLLVRGRASVQVKLPNGETKNVATLQAADYFGEMALLTGETRSATVVAETDCECWRLARDGFKEVVQKRPEIAQELSRILAARKVALQNMQNEAGAAQTLAAAQRDIFSAITQFFGL